MTIIEIIRKKLNQLLADGIEPDTIYLGKRTLDLLKAENEAIMKSIPNAQVNTFLGMRIVEVEQQNHIGFRI